MASSANKLDRLSIDPRDKQPVNIFVSTRKSLYRMLGLVGIALVAVIYSLSSSVFGSAFSVEIGTVTIGYPSQLYSILNATGYVVPQTKADIASKATGRLEWIGVEEGAQVEKGEIIARLENRDVFASMKEAEAKIWVSKARLKEAQAELANANDEFKRTEDLIEKKFVSNEAHDRALARYRKAVAGIDVAKATIAAAEASYEGAKVAVEYTLIRAPFDGVILSKTADIGDIMAPFSSTIESKGAVVSMADMDTLEVEADVSESNLLKVHLNQPCEVELDAIPKTRFRCLVNRIVPTVDRSKATVLVKVRFIDKHQRILPDMSAKVSFLSKQLTPQQQKPKTMVQPSAIVTRNGQSVAFLVQANKARMLSVEVGEKMGDLIVVASGLSSGNKVVLNPPAALQDGSEISIQES